MKKLIYVSLVNFLLLFSSCNNDDDSSSNSNIISISGLNFIGEQIIPDGQMFNGQVVGGLSSIDYHNNKYYIISDAPSAPIRFYTASLEFDESNFNNVMITDQVELLNKQGVSFGEIEADPEGIRFDPISGNVVWISEGYANDQVDPFVRQADLNGQYVKEYTIPEMFKPNSTNENTGVRNNGVFEGISLSADNNGYWVGMELPLLQDGPAPVFGMDTDSKVRIAYIDRDSGEFGRQFTYDLGPVVRDGGFTVNGLVELLEYEENKFLVLERSFASGFEDGGNDVFVYKVDATNATDVSSMETLNGTVVPATKELLFSFNDIRSQLSTVPGASENVVDNLEGMTFGADLPNGNKSLVFIADNNFSAFGPQLNQFIVLEVLP